MGPILGSKNSVHRWILIGAFISERQWVDELWPRFSGGEYREITRGASIWVWSGRVRRREGGKGARWDGGACQRKGEEIAGTFSICSPQREGTWQRWSWRTTGPEHQGLVRHVQEFWFHPGGIRGVTERLSLCSDRWHLGFHQGSDRVKVMFLQNQVSCGSETESGGAGPEAGRASSKASLLRALGVKTQPLCSAPFLATWLH